MVRLDRPCCGRNIEPERWRSVYGFGAFDGSPQYEGSEGQVQRRRALRSTAEPNPIAGYGNPGDRGSSDRRILGHDLAPYDSELQVAKLDDSGPPERRANLQ